MIFRFDTFAQATEEFGYLQVLGATFRQMASTVSTRRSLLKPSRDDLFTRMDVDHLERPVTRILELVGRVGRRNHDLPTAHF